MTGERLYSLYCQAMSQLPTHITKGEALPAWQFVQGPLRVVWEELASYLTLAAKPKAKKKP